MLKNNVIEKYPTEDQYFLLVIIKINNAIKNKIMDPIIWNKCIEEIHVNKHISAERGYNKVKYMGLVLGYAESGI